MVPDTTGRNLRFPWLGGSVVSRLNRGAMRSYLVENETVRKGRLLREETGRDAADIVDNERRRSKDGDEKARIHDENRRSAESRNRDGGSRKAEQEKGKSCSTVGRWCE